MKELEQITNEIRIGLLWLRILVKPEEKYYITKTLDLLDNAIKEIDIDIDSRNY